VIFHLFANDIGLYCRPGPVSGVEHKTVTSRPAEATCLACIEAYETRPQPVTTADLLKVLQVARALAREGRPRVGGRSPASAAAHALEQRLKRPRRVKPETSPQRNGSPVTIAIIRAVTALMEKDSK
jgi:hypothetical protein